MQVYENVSELYLTMGGNVTIESDGTITGAKSVSQSNHKLTIEGKGGIGGSTVFMNGGIMTIQNNGSSYNNFASVGSFGGSFGGGSFIGNVGNAGMTFINNECNIGNGGGTAVINGVEVDLSRLNEIATKPPLEFPKVPTKTYKLGSSCMIESVSIKGSSSLNPIPSGFLSAIFSIRVTGSGDVYLDDTVLFEKLTINLQGSGDVTGNKTVAKRCDINLVGSGDVKDIHMKKGSINLVGSGDVKVTADNPNTITKNKIGSGSIKCNY